MTLLIGSTIIYLLAFALFVTYSINDFLRYEYKKLKEQYEQNAL